MLQILSAHSGEHEIAISAMAVFAPVLAGWINRSQQDAVEYLITENRILREKLGKKRILLYGDQRLRLAVKGKILGRKILEQLASIATPETILRSL